MHDHCRCTFISWFDDDASVTLQTLETFCLFLCIFFLIWGLVDWPIIVVYLVSGYKKLKVYWPLRVLGLLNFKSLKGKLPGLTMTPCVTMLVLGLEWFKASRGVFLKCARSCIHQCSASRSSLACPGSGQGGVGQNSRPLCRRDTTTLERVC